MVVAQTDASARFERFGVTEAQIAAAAVQALAESAGFLPPDARAPKGAERRLVRVVVDHASAIASAPGGAAGVRVGVTLELSGTAGGSPVRESGVGEGEMRPGEGAMSGVFARASNST